MVVDNKVTNKNRVTNKVTNKNRYISYLYNVIPLTQNQNESINSIVWSRCPKGFCRIHDFTISVCDTVPPN